MVKCNLGEAPELKSNTIWKKCKDNCKNYFYKEIELISPKLILIMGNQPYDTLMDILKSKEIDIHQDDSINLNRYLIDFPSRKFGYFTLGKKKIYFYQIYHNSYYFYGLNKATLRPLYKTQNQAFFKQEIIPKVLHWDRSQS